MVIKDPILEFALADYTLFNDVHGSWDSIATIVTQLLITYSMTYNVHYTIAQHYIRSNGQSIVSLKFKRAEDAMVVKIGGLSKVNN